MARGGAVPFTANASRVAKMKSDINWDDLACFCVVARTANLTHAGRETGLSAATLGRRMKALEAQLGRRLFRHGTEGYTPTSEGRALLARASRMEAAAADITQWQTETKGPVRVRLSAGSWTSLYLADHLHGFWQPGAVWLPEFVFCNQDMDIARRDVDIGIRNRRPAQPWLAGRKTRQVTYAAYGRDGQTTGWIGANQDAIVTPSLAWVAHEHGGEIVTGVNDPRLGLSLAQQGVGRIVLPCFAGDIMPGLRRLSPPIAALEHEEWLVSHQDTRHDPPIRAALDAIAAFLSATP